MTSIFSGFRKGRQPEPVKKEPSRKKEKVVLKKPHSVKKSAASVKTEAVADKKIEGKEKMATSLTGRVKKTGRPAAIFTFPHLSEKATELEEEGKYVFRVDPRANKIEIKKAFEEMHRVKVISVNIINIPRKKRIWRGQSGYRPGYKKAIIQVAKGQKANIH